MKLNDAAKGKDNISMWTKSNDVLHGNGFVLISVKYHRNRVNKVHLNENRNDRLYHLN
jgi:hypothetical protein